jgi:hypothetical protein
MDRYGRMMLDTCATCLRLADIVAVDRVLQMQTSLIISNAHVSAPSVAGLPLLVSGGLCLETTPSNLHSEIGSINKVWQRLSFPKI